MKTFDELWKDIEERSQRWAIPIVQDYKELERVYNLIKGCKSYLEIGTAEGNGLYVLAHALASEAQIKFIDLGEKHTEDARNEVLKRLQASLVGGQTLGYLGNSHDVRIISRHIQVFDLYREEFEVVFIDAGHTYEDVLADAFTYGWMASKYIIFHDIQLPEVRKAFDWYCAQNPQFKVSTFINSTTYGYGIIEV